ncbi:hypothetical protein CH29_gp07 [Achromobacter phage JWAlpha]|uniref:Uncharacterized protein n=1 Tax=Achromobacter phage JWAlpha TaxID=1416009 RepID=V9VF46_9CAUD|nr:hypothetical protein CH29_gp07 [Achromobacter phage JWAlpha]AHC93960.1 hypothetical protein JJJB_0007 [Achromobacter phage JWAlpha]
MNIDNFLIILAVVLVIAGVIMAYWDQLWIAVFEFQFGRWSPEMAMKNSYYLLDRAASCPDPEMAKIYEARGIAYEKYANLILEKNRAQR